MASSVPSAIPALMSIAVAALPSGFQVFQGTQWPVYEMPQALMLGEVRFTEDTYAELGPSYRHEEHYAIACQLCSAYGNNDQAGRMQEVYGYFTTLQIALYQQPTLNGTVRLAWPAQLGYIGAGDTNGLQTGVLDFEVQCQARVNSLS